MLTCGDSVSDVNIDDLISFHKSHGKAITMTSVQPEGRYGSLVVNNEQKVVSFQEKPKGDGAWINAGFFVCQPEVFDHIPDGEKVIFEREPLESLSKSGELFSFKHEGFWKPMDTQRDKTQLEELIDQNKAPWIRWA
jgi:glucose-1-phosphate cytidylyltransferase